MIRSTSIGHQAGSEATPARQEPRAGDRLGDAGPVQVGGDAAQVERPAGAEEHAQVDVLHRLRRRPRRASAGSPRPARPAPASRTSPRSSGRVAGVEQPASSGSTTPGLAVDRRTCRARPSCRRFSPTANRSGNASCMRLGHVQRHRRADQLQQLERASSAGRAGRARGRRRSTGVPCVDRRGDLAEEPGEQPVDHERRGVRDQHAGLLQRLADGERGGQRRRRRSARPARSPAAAAPRPG